MLGLAAACRKRYRVAQLAVGVVEAPEIAEGEGDSGEVSSCLCEVAGSERELARLPLRCECHVVVAGGFD